MCSSDLNALTGSWVQSPDYVKALDVYNRLLREFKKGDTRWRDQAEEAVKRILRAEVSLAVSQAFLPGSEVSCQISWRNVARVNLALYPVDLSRDVRFDGREPQRDVQGPEWLTRLDLSKLERLTAWTHETKDTGDHVPGAAELRVESKLDAERQALRRSRALLFAAGLIGRASCRERV